MNRFYFHIVTVLAIICAAGTATAADAKVEEQVVGPPGKFVGFKLSPSGGHVAALLRKGSRFVVAVDGVEGPKIDEVAGHVAQLNDQPISLVVFSDDGKQRGRS